MSCIADLPCWLTRCISSTKVNVADHRFADHRPTKLLMISDRNRICLRKNLACRLPSSACSEQISPIIFTSSFNLTMEKKSRVATMCRHTNSLLHTIQIFYRLIKCQK